MTTYDYFRSSTYEVYLSADYVSVGDGYPQASGDDTLVTLIYAERDPDSTLCGDGARRRRQAAGNKQICVLIHRQRYIDNGTTIHTYRLLCGKVDRSIMGL